MTEAIVSTWHKRSNRKCIKPNI